jgi:ATP-dependent DNA helicase RecQ
LREAEQRAVQRALAGKTTLLEGSPRARDAAIFIAAARLSKRPVLVASPLASELYQQAQCMPGVEVVAFGSFVTAEALAAARKRFNRGGSLLVVVEPAQLFRQELRKAVDKAPIALLGIAAAHACSEHAHEISPAYLSLREAQRAFGVTTLATCTRTTERVIEQIDAAIGAGKGGIIAAAPRALEQTAQVVRSAERRAALLAAIRNLGAPGIVLTATAQEADAVFAELSTRGVDCVRAHPGMAAAEREAALSRFRSSAERLVLVSMSPHANASGLAGCVEASLGLGSTPPRPDLRFVIHYQAPLSLEQQFEDLAWLAAGSSSLVLADSSDAALVQALLAQQRIKPAAIEAVAQALAQAPTDRPAYSDTLALRAGTSRRSAERVLSALADRNLIARESGSIARRATPELLGSEARLLSARFAALRAADTARADAIERYVISRHVGASAAPTATAAVSS